MCAGCVLMSSIVDNRAESVYASFPNESARVEHVNTAIRPAVNPATGHGPQCHDVSRPMITFSVRTLNRGL